MVWILIAPHHKTKVLVTGLALGILGLVALAALFPSAEDSHEVFVATARTPSQHPITEVETRPAREMTSRMQSSELVLGVTIGPEARAYPINMMAGQTRHGLPNQEILNDRLGGEAIVVTWCELCHIGAVYAREVDGQELNFGFAGQIWKGNLVLYDRETNTFWSQFLGEGERGPLRGKKLRPIPVVKTDWQSWYAQYPEGTVAALQRNSQSYRTESYASRRTELVVGIAAGRTAKAWSFQRLKKEPALNDEFGNQPVLVVFEPKSYTARMYARTLEDQVLTFFFTDGKIEDEQTGSTWELVSGRAVAGPLAGKSLTPLPATVSPATAWLKFHPSTIRVE